MNGSRIKAVADTNFLFMNIYNRNSKAGKIIDAAIDKKIELFAPDTVKIELGKVLKKEFSFTQEEIEEAFENLPIQWIEKEIYVSSLQKTSVKHKADKPIEALALILDCGILTADKHFDAVKNKININEFLEKIK